jgi:saccharolysin
MSTAQLTPPQEPVQWNHTPETVISETERLIAEAKALDDKLAAISLEEATIDTVILPYADLENRQAGLSNQLSFYQHVSADKALREASNEADAKFRKYGIDAGLREDVFKVINKVYLDNKDNDKLDQETKRFIEKVNKQYERNGLSLPLETREKVKILKQELSTLSLKFSSNLSEETGFNLYTKEQLENVPEDVVNGFEKVEEDGTTTYKMTFKYPDLFPVLKYAKDAETRKTAFTADQNKCPENAELLIKAVKIRAELSQLLGYKNFSEYILEERMAKTPENVMNFLEDLKVKLKPLGEKEVEYLKSLKEKETGKSGEGYYIWDQRYYHTKMLENDYNVDEIKISEYFPMQNTIAKMLSIYETIFNLKFVEIEKSDKYYNTWHEEVKQYQVWKMDDPKNPVFIGYLYFDLHPRAGKYGHAANFGQVPSYIDVQTGKKNYPSTSLVCNFTKDTAEKPSLLKHGEVVTFFHELGHGIHDLMGQTKFSRFHGTSVSWDFVEMPSQLLEYFCWDESMLTKLSSHYKTADTLPENLIKSLVASKNVNGAMFNLRQLHFGLFDMALHTSKDGNLDVDSLWNNMREEICLISNGDVDFKGYGSFGHLMGGYASGYYGYLWSNVFAADVFFTKFAEDPLNVKSGMDYRNKILARGGSRDEMDNLVDLLGRKPESTNFLKELGL